MSLLADIYEGKITKWNDPKVTEANQGVTLPNLAIAPVYRADGSGTTLCVYVVPLRGQPDVEGARWVRTPA